ncbi:MAG: hypothetical protein IJ577_07895 [Prevotella sp.]|nr:hypothetical protein [Prevotella sp.]
MSCSKDIEAPVLPEPVGTPITSGTSLDASRLFGVWGANNTYGPAGGTQYEQNYRVEFQSVEDGEAVLSHWFTDGSTEVEDSAYQIEYTYTLDGSTVELTPKAAYQSLGADAIKGVHIGNDRLALYIVHENFTDTICTLSRIGDPEPSITGIDRTMPHVGETVTITGRNLQFVDHIYLPTPDGEVEVTDFKPGSKQIRFTLPSGTYAPGSIRCQSTSAHVSCYSPAYMFCHPCVFFHSFSNFGTSAPYTGTEFEYTISSMGNLLDQVSPVCSDSLPDGHSLFYAPWGMQHPDSLLSFFGDAPKAWPVEGSTDPSTGYLRFSSADRFQHVIDNSGGIVTGRSRCNGLAIQMDVYVYSDGEPAWSTGYMSYRLNKDQSSLTSTMNANLAMWEEGSPVSFADGWKTFTIPLSAFRFVASDATMSLSGLIGQLKASNLQTIIKMVNYPLDDLHPAESLNSFQFNIANMRLVPYQTPANTKE